MLATSPSPSPNHAYAASYDFKAVNRHPVDLFRLFLFKPNREVVDRFVEEGIIERDEVEVIRKGWKGVGIGVAVGASFGSLLLITATRSFKKIADPLTRFGQDGFVGLMGALIGSSQLGWPVGAFWGGETIYKGTRNGGETSLLIYKYMSAVQDPKHGLPPIGSPLFSDNGRPNFAIRRPLDWQRVGSRNEVDQNVDGGWKSLKKLFGVGYGK
ncbi:hypothetical protein BDY24DRAFT_115218 [Mrakia frigida]|uniref:uncharacterized protein n=1 Tax=Mrakia frigida TaxID=29902 RepID=UPI003FCC1278